MIEEDMIKNIKILEALEDDFIRREGVLPYSRAMKIIESMWNEGIKLGVIPSKEPLEGIDVDIKIAGILNSCLKKSSPG